MMMRAAKTLALLATVGLGMANVTPTRAHQAQISGDGQDAAAATAVANEAATRKYFSDLPLVTQEGKHVRFYTDVLKDNVVLINFIYTNCRDACPLLTRKLTQVKAELGDVFGREIHFVSISVDPARDTPQALAKFARQQNAEHPGWVFLTGAKHNVETILKTLGQYSPEVNAHSTLLRAGNVKTHHWTKIRPMAPVPAIALKLKDLASEG